MVLTLVQGRGCKYLAFPFFFFLIFFFFFGFGLIDVVGFVELLMLLWVWVLWVWVMWWRLFVSCFVWFDWGDKRWWY